jgi:hypothetical protein
MTTFQLGKISATNLAALALDNFCPRCFWMKARLGFKSPFAMFPKIFNDLDGYQKSFTKMYWETHRVLPPWLAEMGEVESVVQVPEYGKFCAMHPSGVMISGVPDQIWRLKSQKLLIPDYKTSRPHGDAMFASYKFQLSVYAWISPRFGVGEVEKTCLLYYEPMTMQSELSQMSYGKTEVEGINLQFRPFLLKIEPLPIDELVLKAKALAEQEQMPDPYQFCKECDRVLDWARNFLVS